MTEVKKTTIRPDISGMTKTVGGSYHKPDFVGNTLSGLSVAQVLVIAVACGLSADKYTHLNPGQQRMTLGNSLRKLTNIVDVPNDAEGKPDQKVVDKNEEAAAMRDKIEDMALEMRAANDAAKETKVAEKAAIAAEKKAAKDAAAKAKAAAKASAAAPVAVVEGEGSEI